MAGRAAAVPAASKLSGLALGAAAAAVAYQCNNDSAALCDALPVHGVAGTNQERTFLAVKPDGVQRGLVGDIIARFEKRGYKVTQWMDRLHTICSVVENRFKMTMLLLLV